MILQERIDLLGKLGNYMLSNDAGWVQTKEKAFRENAWFIPEFIDLAVKNIATQFLQKDPLQKLTTAYSLPPFNEKPKIIGIVMAGNIPLVGFHDWLCVFITGNKAVIKLSSKDEILFKHLSEIIFTWKPELKEETGFSELLKNCDAYLATGSNNTSRYFEYYFGKYPHIIRKNKTSVAILTGNETKEELEKLADDIHQFFGLGCRNVTKIFVPQGYDFVPLLEALKKYNYLAHHHKYKNNYDYNLAIHILNNKYYMTNGSVMLVEDKSLFSPIAQLNYEYYSETSSLIPLLNKNNELQCIVGKGGISFGEAQCPSITDFADGVDTMAFLSSLRN